MVYNCPLRSSFRVSQNHIQCQLGSQLGESTRCLASRSHTQSASQANLPAWLLLLQVAGGRKSIDRCRLRISNILEYRCQLYPIVKQNQCSIMMAWSLEVKMLAPNSWQSRCSVGCERMEGSATTWGSKRNNRGKLMRNCRSVWDFQYFPFGKTKVE